MSRKIVLKGITWNHSRSLTPLLAFSQRFSELHPEVEVIWEKKTLQELMYSPVERLAEEYDFIMIVHPSIGHAASANCIIALDNYLEDEYLDDQARNSVGYSFLSYHYEGHQWALAIDAATHVSGIRRDLFYKNNASAPRSWQDVLDLAKESKVILPSTPVNVLMYFYMFCHAFGGDLFVNKDEVIDLETGVYALQAMQTLYNLIPREMFSYNSVTVAEKMTTVDDFWYCPFTIGYSNYARNGYAKNLLEYNDLVHFESTTKFKSTLAGAGLSVSRHCKYRKLAVEFVETIASRECQSTLYVTYGGQPGHRSAWLSKSVNIMTNNYFSNTLPTLDRAFMQPRYNGYLHFQNHAGHPIQQYLLNDGNPEIAIREINALYVGSQYLLIDPASCPTSTRQKIFSR